MSETASETRRHADRRFLITGCASGIGRHLAGRFLAAGARVAATDLDEESLRAVAEAEGWPSSRTLLASLDVRDPGAWQRVADEVATTWTGLDVVLNVAGFLRPAEVRAVSDEDVHRHFDVNVKGVVFGTREAARRMARGGHVVNFASMAALAPIPGLALYSASKYAVRAFSLAAAEELRPAGIAVTAVCPDAVATPMLDLQLDFAEAALTFTAPRLLSVEEIGRAIERILRRRPLLVSLPRRRAALARLADLLPASARFLAPLLRRRGLDRQEDLRRRRAQDAR